MQFDNSGDIGITARNINMLGKSSLLAGITSRFGSVDSKAGDITLNATETIQINNQSSINNIVLPDTRGNAGNIRINTGSLSVTNGAQLSAITLGQGNAGNFTINARESIVVDGFRYRVVGRDKSGGLIINMDLQ